MQGSGVGLDRRSGRFLEPAPENEQHDAQHHLPPCKVGVVVASRSALPSKAHRCSIGLGSGNGHHRTSTRRPGATTATAMAARSLNPTITPATLKAAVWRSRRSCRTSRSSPTPVLPKPRLLYAGPDALSVSYSQYGAVGQYLMRRACGPSGPPQAPNRSGRQPRRAWPPYLGRNEAGFLLVR